MTPTESPSRSSFRFPADPGSTILDAPDEGLGTTVHATEGVFDKGLVVIGVPSADQSDKLNNFLKEKKITFPVMIDQGDTAQRYAIEGWPTYFLIEKTGTVAWGFAHNPPSTAQIEELLKK